ncbi:hypothetical protein HNR42_002735 [Deinobacterium chartae]|uniref:LPS export ABC transporter periplasmic protein LptC n=1 Tax=Deinobacterium chartae TaxID=521158 RepID=A0A841I0U9_9DEIO|nr:hypothetical protein [Deinobacterium chartae]MBB6099297.1 hypothetical protein [Deinobacterium chartae]
MLKYAPWALLALIALGIVVALLPTPRVEAGAGVQLSGVSMRLYPAQDPDAVWVFRTDRIAYNPQKGESRLEGLQNGERRVRGKLDMTIRTDQLTIDAYDNLRTPQAVLTIPEQCATITLGDPQGGVPVLIDQDRGFSGPSVRMETPSYTLVGKSISAPFDLGADTSIRGAEFVGDLDSPFECVGGKVVNKGART